MTLRMRSYVNGKLVQNFPVTDYVFNPYADRRRDRQDRHAATPAT